MEKEVIGMKDLEREKEGEGEGEGEERGERKEVKEWETRPR